MIFLTYEVMKTNTAVKRAPVFTHEGAKTSHINAEQKLRRSVMSCLLWESEYYEDGVEISARIKDLIPQVKAEKVASIAVEAREEMKLRHVPLLIVREMARHPGHKALVGSTLSRIIQRADELAEFVSLYWKEKKQPLSKQVKLGLAQAFTKFDEYQLAKYNRDNAVKLRDVLFLCHAKPKDEAQAQVWKRLIDGTLNTPDTWEVELSASKDKKASWTRLLDENKLGALALLRNLRNMKEADVDQNLVRIHLDNMKTDRVLPFRFISAARTNPTLEPTLEQAMFRSLKEVEKLPGKTAIVVDNSGSMHGTKVSAKSDIDRADAACALAILLREVCEDVVVVGFGSNAQVVPSRRGFALADAIKRGPGGGTNTDYALQLAEQEGYDRIIVVTDEQSHQTIREPKTRKAYFVNVACNKNGIGYGRWTHIDGWSESILRYIQTFETDSTQER